MADSELVRLIRDTAVANTLPSLLLVGLAYLENARFDPDDESGDGGNAFGLFQMNIRVWGIPAHRWHGIEGTAASMRTMMARWLTAYRTTTAAGYDFEADPAGFLMAWWKPAQGGSAILTRRQCDEAISKARAALAAAEQEQPMGQLERLGIVWKGAHPQNYRASREGYAPEGVVIHTAAGTLAGCDSWFNTYPHIVGGRDVGPASAHFCIGRKGEIHQYVDLGDTAIANGNRPEATAWLVRENGPLLNANWYTISIEHDDLGRGAPPTPAQFEASARLTAALFVDVILPGGASNVAVDRNHIAGHYEFDPIDRPNCPGWPEGLDRYVARVAELVAEMTGAQPEPEPEPEISPAWQLRVGLAERCARAALALTDHTIAITDALATTRNLAVAVVTDIDIAGGSPAL